MAENESDIARVTAFVAGHVQGVGFRWWTSSQARELGVKGYAKNLHDGKVEVLAQGTPTAVQELLERLQEQPSSHNRPGKVSGVTIHDAPPVGGLTSFDER